MRTDYQIVYEAKIRHAFTQGYACAVANYIRMHGIDTPIEEVWRDGVGSIEKAKREGVEDFDMEILEKHFK